MGRVGGRLLVNTAENVEEMAKAECGYILVNSATLGMQNRGYIWGCCAVPEGDIAREPTVYAVVLKSSLLVFTSKHVSIFVCMLQK